MFDDRTVPAPDLGDGVYDQPATAVVPATACLLIGLTIAVPIVPEARLTLFDVIAVILFLRGWRTTMGLFKPAGVILGISALAMAVSAYLNESALIALASREFQMVALALEMMAYGVLLAEGDDRSRAALALGVAAGICCHYFYPNDLRVLDEPIKFLVGIPLGVGLLALLAVAWPRAGAAALLTFVLMIGYVAFCFLLGSRSVGGVFFVAAFVTVGIGIVKIPRNYRKIAPVLIVVAGLLLYALTEVYAALAINGLFGSQAAGIAAFQSSFGSILLGGRPEVIVNMSGVRDAPFFGVGILNYPSIYLYEMVRLSVYSQDLILDVDNILYHSALFGTAFESGIIAALFWGYLLYMTLMAVPLLKDASTGQRAFIAPLLLITTWHILYSPPIAYNRFVMGLGAAFAIVLYAEWKMRQAAMTEALDEGDDADVAESYPYRM
ncbi:hypothetical protein [uncultured Sphingomonas sp.]|uniref:hypothetical protein n=1 Tax=uncultured Sphingomonas sp. TaxID=158754 RepID=UPI0025FC4C0B|nr:hypothetical protein [uncultured Sphingomonas sp.]